MERIRVVIVEDHPLFRQWCVDSLSLEPDIDIVGQADNGDMGLKMVTELKPDVAVIDVNLPGQNGQQVMRHIVTHKLMTRVILLTAYDDVHQKIHAMQGGAAAYCTKDIQPGILLQVIRSVAEGKFFVSGQTIEDYELTRWLNSQTESALRSYGDPGEPFHPLSAREMEVLACVTRGMSNKEIASWLKISHQTVKNHVTSILRKLGVEDRTQAAIYALRYGWVRLHQQDPQSKE